MKKVLIIGMHDLVGGVETFLMSYYKHIDKSKIQMDFLSIYPKLCFENELKEMGAKIHMVSDFKRNPVRYAKELSNIIKNENYDVVHVNMLSAANFIPFVVAHKCKVKKIIAHAHNTGTPNGFLRKILHFACKKIILSNATDFWACSKKAGNWLFGNKQNYTVIHNAIDVKKFTFNTEAREKIRAEFELQDKFVIGHVGRFHEQKNHNFLIDIFAKVYEQEKNAALLLVGDGELRKEIEKKVCKLGLQNAVVFAGVRENIQDFYQAFDVFVLPSLFEGLAITLIEAQCASIASIASDPVPPEANITELLQYLPFDADRWASAILDIKNNPKEKINRFVQIKDAGYDIAVEADKMEKLYGI